MPSSPTTYWDYIKVEPLLALQSGLESDERQLSNDEVLFITVHQIDELWFKLVLRDLTAVRTLFALVDDPRLNHRIEAVGGILAPQCAALLRDFFVRMRQDAQKGLATAAQRHSRYAGQ